MTEFIGENFEQESQKTALTMFVLFTTPVCVFCKSMKRTIEKLESELNEIRFYFVDVSNKMDICEKYDIHSVPTSMIFNDGCITAQATGLLTKSEILTLLDTAKVNNRQANNS